MAPPTPFVVLQGPHLGVDVVIDFDRSSKKEDPLAKVRKLPHVPDAMQHGGRLLLLLLLLGCATIARAIHLVNRAFVGRPHCNSNVGSWVQRKLQESNPLVMTRMLCRKSRCWKGWLGAILDNLAAMQMQISYFVVRSA
jgi:hypothetical protein